MINGIDHVGIGVTNIENAQNFYRDFLGFKNVIFDYTGKLPGMDQVVGRSDVKARILMLASENYTPIAQGAIKLVQLLPPSKPNRPEIKSEWSAICIAEVGISVKNIEEVYNLAMEKGFRSVLPPTYNINAPQNEECKFAYIRDPDGVLIELIDWHMYKEFDFGVPRMEAVNHLGIGVRDMKKTMTFYKDVLGFDEIIVDYKTKMDIMAPMLPSPTPTTELIIVTNKYRGVWLEAFQHFPYEPLIAVPNWGDFGPMEFAISVSNIQKEYEQLQRKGIRFLCPPQKAVLPPSGEWKYCYMRDPDGFLVSLVEY
jgi:catechol 2,3-dioxygenase-like lactoylglutathione lyase family enzyme